jgi:uncharacterized damage-inducible protein DinB
VSLTSAVELVCRTMQPLRGPAWHGGPTPVGALRGVGAEQARWHPPHGRQSIWRLALHIAYWKYTVRRHLEGGSIPRFPRSPANFPAVPAIANNAAWKADRDLLAEEHLKLVAAMNRLDSRLLDRRPPSGKRWTWGEMVIGVLVHDAYHTGQIQLLKRLWERRKASDAR